MRQVRTEHRIEDDLFGIPFDCPKCHQRYLVEPEGWEVVKGKEAYAEIPGRYYKAVVETKRLEKAGEAAFSGVDMAELERDWKDFWSRKVLFDKSKHYEVKPVVEPPKDSVQGAGAADSKQKVGAAATK